MNKIYKIVNTDTQKAICKFSVAGDETLDLLAAIKFVGGILSADNTEASFDNGQSYIKIFDLYLAEISRSPTANLTDHNVRRFTAIMDDVTLPKQRTRTNLT